MENKSTQRLVMLGVRIKTLRKSKGWTQETFAMQVGLDRSYMGGIERGERNITFDTMCMIANTLDIELSELLAGI